MGLAVNYFFNLRIYIFYSRIKVSYGVRNPAVTILRLKEKAEF